MIKRSGMWRDSWGAGRARPLEIDLLGMQVPVLLERVPVGTAVEWGLA